MTDSTAPQPSIDLGRYWSVLIARWPVVVIGAVVGLLVGGGYLLAVPRTYIATTTLSVLPITSDPYAANRNSSNLLDMAAEAVTAGSFKVAEIAATSLDETSMASDLRSNTSVSAGADTATMTISVEAKSEAEARGGAAAVATAYLQVRTDQAVGSIESGVERDRERIADLREQLTTAIERVSAEPVGSPAGSEASADQQILNLQISALLTRISTLEGVDTTGGVILNPASASAVKVEPPVTTVLITGLIAGIGLGVIAAFVTHSRRKNVRDARDLQREFDLEPLTSGAEDANGAVATATQRLLHSMAVQRSSSLALIFAEGVTSSVDLTDLIVKEMRSSGEAVIAPSEAEASRVESRTGLRVTAVPAGADVGTRLQALRTSRSVVLIAAAGETRMKNVASLIDECRSMDAHVVGAIVVPTATTRSASRLGGSTSSQADGTRPSQVRETSVTV